MTNQFSSLVNNATSGSSVTSRFSAAAWFDFVQRQRVTVTGVGGIGSWLAFMLARLNPSHINLYDDDIIDSTNMAGQLYSRRDIGKLKVSSMADLIYNFADYRHVSIYDERITSDYDDSLGKVVFCGFDNMEARRTVFNLWKNVVSQVPESEKKNCLLIDGRLSAETLQIFCIPGDAPYYMEEYEKNWLFSDSEAESTVCSYKQTSYCANLIASLMTNLFVNWCTNHCNPIIERSVPFMTEYSAEQMYLKEEV